MSNTNQKSKYRLVNFFRGTLNPINFFRIGYKIMREEKNEKTTWAFAILYFCELASYMTFVLCIPEVGTIPKIWYPMMLFSGTLIGGFLASFLIARYHWGIKKTLSCSAGINFLGVFVLLLANLCVEYANTVEDFKIKLWAYGIFGFGFAPSIGLMIAQVIERRPRYNRSFSIGFIHAIGFLAPVLIAGICVFNENLGNQTQLTIIKIAAILSIVALFMLQFIPKDVPIKDENKHSFIEWLSWFGLNLMKKEDTELNARYFWHSAAIGTNMLFFFFLFSNIGKIKIQEGFKNYEVIFFSYIGLVLGTLFWSWRAKITGSRRKNIITSNGLQFFVLCFYAYALFHDWVLNKADFELFILALGFSCSWVLTLGNATEQFMSKNRLSLMAVLPNLFRFAPLFLALAATKEIPKDNDLAMFYHNIAILIAAMLLLLLSTLAAYNLDDLFGTEPNILDRTNKSIASSELRKKINAIESKRYLHQVNEILSKHFTENLKRQYFLSTFYYRNNDKERRLKSTEFSSVIENPENKEPDLINVKTYEQFNTEPFQDVNKAAYLHTIGDKLITDGKLKSISLWIAENDKYNGLLIWRSEPQQISLRTKEDPNRNRNAKDVGTLVINLSGIEFSHRITEILPASIYTEDWKITAEDWFTKIQELAADKPQFIPEIERFLKEIGKEDRQIAIHSLMHFLMDAAMYPRGSYYRYWIKPYKTVKETIAILMIKASSFIPKNRLGQLRDLVTMIILEKGRIKLEEAKIKIEQQNKEIVNSNSIVSAEHEHHRKYQLSSLQKSIVNVLSRFDINKNDDDYKSITYQLNHLYNTADLFTKLMQSEQEEVLRNLPIDNVPLKATLLNQLDIIKNMMENIETEKIEPFLRLDKKWDKIRQHLDKIDDAITIRVNTTIFHIVIHELLKNAVSHVKNDDPEFSIEFVKSGDSHFLQFINNHNNKMSQESFDFINTDNFNELKGIGARRAGIRTLKRLLPVYNRSLFDVKVSEESLTTDETIIYFKIPNECISKL